MAFASGSYHTYYEILGLSPGASLAEIKRAYRTMAKRYHPDLNKSPDAQERFIEINEAYEFLLHLHTKAPAPGTAGRTRRSRSRYYRQPTADELFRRWMENERRKARARAAEAARKRYQEFMKSPVYRTSQVISAVYDYIILGVGVLMITGSVTGMVYELKNVDAKNLTPDEHFDFVSTHITSTLLLSIIGIIFIIFARYNIRERIRSRKKKKTKKQV
jgi:hypothetical protein